MSECNVSSSVQNDLLQISLAGRIDSANAAAVEASVLELRQANATASVCIDAEKLEYISSAGLRILLKLQKGEKQKVQVLNVKPEVYEIFDVTGFVEILDVKKALRKVSIEGCERLGVGGTGAVYRLSGDTIVKVYHPHITLQQIEQERKFAKTAFVQGVPTAIAFDIVRCGDSYGTVYELLDSDTFARAIVKHPEKFDEYMDKYVALVNTLHGIHVPAGSFDSIKDVLHPRIDLVAKYMEPGEVELMHSMVDDMRDTDTLVHGDLHPGNIMLQGDELMIIDMADMTTGAPIYDLTCLYRDLVSAAQSAPQIIEQSVGMKTDMIAKVWQGFITRYLGTTDAAEIDAYEKKLQLLYMFNLVPMMALAPAEMLEHAIPRLTAVLRQVVIPNEKVLRQMLSTL